jgi:trimethylamine--corrinoid protein Co-methyltransferase
MGGPGHYLGEDQTLKRMQSDYVYPTLGDRTSPKEWVERGKPNLLEKATKRKVKILSERSKARFDHKLDASLRKKHKIHLPT